jgi:hypothetical protein
MLYSTSKKLLPDNISGVKARPALKVQNRYV